MSLTEDHVAQITNAIETAENLAGVGQRRAAVQAFALARSLAVELPGRATIAQISRRNEAVYEAERQRHRQAIANRRPTGQGLVIFADSLGLPRPVAKDMPALEDRVYPELIADEMADRAVTSLCQRFFTTDHVRQLLAEDATLGAGADVILHVGLNDCANRMFLEAERLSMDLLPKDVSARIVQFSQKYRRDILSDLPSRHYVAPEMFAANLDAIMAMLKQREARKVILTTIILPPVRSWASTPGINYNFGRYNQMIMAAALRHGATLFDFDRHAWQNQHNQSLLDDGMHLASEGHRIFAREVIALLNAR